MSARRAAIAIGVLFWISNLSTIAGAVITGPLPSADTGYGDLQLHATKWVAGTLVTHINDAAIIGYAVLLFPVLKRYDEGLALAYVAFKIVEAVMLLFAAALLLSLTVQIGLPLSKRQPALFVGSDALAMAQNFWASRLGTLAYLVATPILNYLLYRSRLVPRFISILGFVGVLGLVIGLLTGVGDPTRGFEVAQLLVIPIILWELVFATWLIVRGFDPRADGMLKA